MFVVHRFIKQQVMQSLLTGKPQIFTLIVSRGLTHLQTFGVFELVILVDSSFHHLSAPDGWSCQTSQTIHHLEATLSNISALPPLLLQHLPLLLPLHIPRSFHFSPCTSLWTNWFSLTLSLCFLSLQSHFKLLTPKFHLDLPLFITGPVFCLSCPSLSWHVYICRTPWSWESSH